MNPVHTHEYAQARRRMIEEIEAMSEELLGLLGEAVPAKVLAVMKKVPRHRFIPTYLRSNAYSNYPLPIGHDQTISQPFIVALMTAQLALTKRDRVLEVGTGSGYQTAVLAELAGQVCSLEIIESLAAEAKALLGELGYTNITVRVGNGCQGWPENTQFDKIMVTAAAPDIPPTLLDQLKPGGRMIIPVGERYATQELLLVSKLPTGEMRSKRLLEVSFVPLVGTPPEKGYPASRAG